MDDRPRPEANERNRGFVSVGLLFQLTVSIQCFNKFQSLVGQSNTRIQSICKEGKGGTRWRKGEAVRDGRIVGA